MGARRAGSIGAVVCAGGLLAATTAAALPATGDRCEAFGNAGSYTLQITIPAHAPLQLGLAFATPGTSTLNLDVPGGDGTPSTTDLPRGVSSQWLFTGGAASGVLTVSIETTGKVTGPITVEPSGKTTKTRYAPVTCTRPVPPDTAFAVHAQAIYDHAARAWNDAVSVPGPGTVDFFEVFTRSGGPLITKSPVPPAVLIEPGFASAAKRETVELILRPSAAGSAVLRTKGSIALYLSVSFRPPGGVPVTKVLRLVLRR